MNNDDRQKKAMTTKIMNDWLEPINRCRFSSRVRIGPQIWISKPPGYVYKPKANIKERSKLLPKSNYSKNKLITEQKLFKQLNKKLLILRISNVIGDKEKIKKIHNTFIDIFFNNMHKGFVFDNKKDFKDFISIDKFCEIMKNIIKKFLCII